jgi:hypothetical protein
LISIQISRVFFQPESTYRRPSSRRSRAGGRSVVLYGVYLQRIDIPVSFSKVGRFRGNICSTSRITCLGSARRTPSGISKVSAEGYVEDGTHIVVVGVDVARSAEDTEWRPLRRIGMTSGDIGGNAGTREEVSLDSFRSPLHGIDTSLVVIEGLAIAGSILNLDLTSSGIGGVAERISRPEIAVWINEITTATFIGDRALPGLVRTASMSSCEGLFLIIGAFEEIEFTIVGPRSRSEAR